MHVFLGVISVAEDGTDAEVPRVFAGVSSMDCVNKAKAYLVENWEVMLEADNASSKAFNEAGTGAELAAWFAAHYAYYQYTEHNEEI